MTAFTFLDEILLESEHDAHFIFNRIHSCTHVSTVCL